MALLVDLLLRHLALLVLIALFGRPIPSRVSFSRSRDGARGRSLHLAGEVTWRDAVNSNARLLKLVRH
jgi:hypothetical protein